MKSIKMKKMQWIVVSVFTLLCFNQIYLSNAVISLEEQNQSLLFKMIEKENKFNEALNIRREIPAEIEFCGIKLDLSNTMIKERMLREIINLRHYRNQVELYKTRAKYFFPMIEFYLKKHGLPEDLKYLAVHESALNTKARSSANAVGIWQFMRYTAKDFNLNMTDLIDDRRDPIKSTEAACKYLKQLNRRFNDWALAIASYNGGPTRVSNAIMDQGEESFFNLVLPEETERYLFKIIATSLVLKDAVNEIKYDEYDEKLAPFQILVENDLLPIRKVCEYFNVSYREFNFFNPQFTKTYLPNGRFVILLPDRGIDKEFQDKIERKEYNWLAVKAPELVKP